jgi:type III restriction enzyme
MIELKEFQRLAADQIAERFATYSEDPPMRGTKKELRPVPFFQALSSITASGKTVILADAVSAICAESPIAPVVLWLSKGKVVVDQSYENLAGGGKYHHLLGSAQFSYLAQYDGIEVAASGVPMVFFATVGTFNERQKEKGDRLIFQSEIDTAEQSIWEALKVRTTSDGIRRPLLIVYDEGHNLTDQQMDLLLELAPDGLIAASATMKIPEKLTVEIDALKAAGWTEEQLVTVVDAKAVSESGLVKSGVILAGYEAPMEETVDSLISDMRKLEQEASQYGVSAPKAIYVCKTNIAEGNSFQKDDPKQPFMDRRSPPILIWRHLTERCKVDAEEIAVYSSLQTSKDFPLPAEFNLFKGGEKDYEAFSAGAFKHIIFNLSLQEGWDDPLCYMAYIDKSMESSIQVEQIIGRLLRQPGGSHAPTEGLNTAHFYVRVDKKGTFNELLGKVNRKLRVDAPGIQVMSSAPGKPKPQAMPAKEERRIFETAYVADDAVAPVEALIDGLIDFRDDKGENVTSAGGRTIVQYLIGDGGEPVFEWEEFEHTNLVVARWLLIREIVKRFPLALGVTPTAAPKLDAMVGFGSKAHEQIAQVASQIVDAYVDNVFLKQRSTDEFLVGSAFVREDEMDVFENALHEGYDGLNQLEREFAYALDATGLRWFRNPSRSGYNIPLITVGRTRNFYPDFIVWSGEDVIAVDTTGGHLLQEKTARKLLSIAPAKRQAGRLLVRLVSEGRWTPAVDQVDSEGFTVWGRKQDGTLRAIHVDSIDAAVERALK